MTIPLSHIPHPNSLANPKSNHSQLPCGLQYCNSFSRVSPWPPQTLLTTAATVALSYTRLGRPHHTSAQNPPTSFRIKASPYSCDPVTLALLDVPQTCRAHCCLRAFVFTPPAACSVLPPNTCTISPLTASGLYSNDCFSMKPPMAIYLKRLLFHIIFPTPCPCEIFLLHLSHYLT